MSEMDVSFLTQGREKYLQDRKGFLAQNVRFLYFSRFIFESFEDAKETAIIGTLREMPIKHEVLFECANDCRLFGILEKIRK